MNLEALILPSPSEAKSRPRPQTPSCQSHNCMTTYSAILSIGAFATSVVVGTDVVMTKAEQAGLVESLTEWRWAAFTALGALFASLTAILLRKDDWRENLARFIFSMVCGLVFSQVFISVHPNLSAWTTNPILMVGLGYLHGLIGFAIAKAFVLWLNKRAPEVALGKAEDWLHRRLKHSKEQEKDGSKTQELIP